MIARHRGAYPLTLMCRVLAVSRAGLPAWTMRGRSARAHEDVALAAAQAVPSLSRAGNCWDNAVVESLFATLKKGLVHRQARATRRSLTRALVDDLDAGTIRSAGARISAT